MPRQIDQALNWVMSSQNGRLDRLYTSEWAVTDSLFEYQVGDLLHQWPVSNLLSDINLYLDQVRLSLKAFCPLFLDFNKDFIYLFIFALSTVFSGAA